MEIRRTELLAALGLVKPAVNDASTMEELTCVWFEDGAISAYNDVIGVRVPVDTFFQGGMKGALLSGLMSSSTADAIDVSIKGENVTMKAGSAKIKLSLLPEKRQIWHAPEVDADRWFTPKSDFLKALDKVMISAKKSSGNPDEMGVTFIVHDDGLSLYSTDNATISWAQVGLDDCPELPINRALIPTVFCEQLLKMGGKDDTPIQLAFLKNAALAKVGERILFGRYLDSQAPIPFPAITKKLLGDDLDDCLVGIPPGLSLALERASVLLSRGGGKDQPVEFQASGDRLRLYTRTAYGTLDEDLELDENESHDEMILRLDPGKVKRVLPHVKQFYMREPAILFAGEGFYHMLSPFTDKKDD